MANVALGVLDVTGITAKTYSYLGNMIDKQTGYSVGRAVHRQIFQEQKIVR